MKYCIPVRPRTEFLLSWSIIFPLQLLTVLARAQSDSPRPEIWVTDGSVHAIASNGSTVFVGGEFDRVGPSVPLFTRLSATTGNTNWITQFPADPNSQGVSCAVPDGNGGWFFGGWFSSIQGQPRNRIAHVDVNGDLLPWNPEIQGQGIWTMFRQGNTLFVGGSFSSIGGMQAVNLAAIDAITGDLIDWNVEVSQAVFDLVVSSNTVYIAGTSGLSAVDAITGQSLIWNPAPNGLVECMELIDGVMLVGGQFTSIGGQPRGYIAAVDTLLGAATSWNPNANSAVSCLVVKGDTVFLGGWFSSVGGQARHGLCAVQKSNGTLFDWQCDTDDPVLGMKRLGDKLYVGGQFLNIGGISQEYLAAVDIGSALPTDWNPRPSSYVQHVMVDDSTICVSGNFASMNMQNRTNLAGFNALTGEVEDWTPDADGMVTALCIADDVVYVGGEFGSLNGQIRDHAAAIDAQSGAVMEWNPGVNGRVNTICTYSSSIYLGGIFTDVGGEPRNYLACVDDGLGAPLAWNPFCNDTVRVMLVVNDAILIGGDFTSVGGYGRNFAAALNPLTGVATSFDPMMDFSYPNGVNSIAYQNGHVFLGGKFTYVQAQMHRNLVAVDEESGMPIGEDYGLYNYDVVTALQGTPSRLYVGFRTQGSNSGLKALDLAENQWSDWQPNVNYEVKTLAIDYTTLYAGGYFIFVDETPRTYFVGYAIDSPTGSSPEPMLDSIDAYVFPNPVADFAIVRFNTGPDVAVAVEVFDSMGHLVMIESGKTKQGVHIDTRSLPTGIYDLRYVTIGNRSGGLKLMVN